MVASFGVFLPPPPFGVLLLPEGGEFGKRRTCILMKELRLSPFLTSYFSVNSFEPIMVPSVKM